MVTTGQRRDTAHSQEPQEGDGKLGEKILTGGQRAQEVPCMVAFLREQ